MDLSIPEIWKLLDNIVIPSKYEQIEDAKLYLLNMLNVLQAEQDELLSSGIISKNGALDYPPEILVKILATSDWNLQLRNLNKYLLEVYNQYHKFKLSVMSQNEMDTIILEYPHLEFLIKVKGFIPTEVLFFRNLDNIYSLDLSNLRIRSDRAIILAGALRTNTTLVNLDLSNNNIGDIGASAIARSLQTNNTLTKLNLKNNKIESEGIKAIATSLKTNTTLTTLILNDNFVRFNGAEVVLAEALKVNKFLINLVLLNCYITGIGAIALANALDINKTLKYLEISNNYISEAGQNAADRHPDRINYKENKIKKLDTLL